MQEKMITGVVDIEKIDIADYNSGKYEPYEIIGPTFNDVSWTTLVSEYITGSGGNKFPITTPATGSLLTYWCIKFAIADFIQSPLNIGVPNVTTGLTFVYANANVGYPTFVAKTLPTDKDYIQFVADLLPAATTRTIYGLGIGVTRNGSTSFVIHDDTDTMTNLRLNTPCTQSASTVLRVTYKLYLDDEFTSPSSTIADGFFSNLRNTLKSSCNGTYTTNFNSATYPSYYGSSYYDLTAIPVSKPISLTNLGQAGTKLSDIGLFSGNTVSAPLTTNAFTISGSDLLGNNHSMGVFVRSLLLYGSGTNSGSLSALSFLATQLDSPFMSQSILPAGTSPIQNIFKQAAGASGPFQDLNYLGTMKGNITIDDSAWATQVYPKVFKVNIVSGGSVGTATYKVETMAFTGGFVQNSYTPRDAILPQDGLNNLATSYYKNNFADSYTLDYVNTGGTTIRTPDGTKYVVTASCQRTKTGISIYNIETGQKIVLNSTSTPSLPVTNVSDIAVSNGYTFVTCSATGLWQIDPTFTTVTHLTSIGAGVDSSKAYQIDVKTNGDLWVLFDGGLCKGITGDSGATWSWTVYNTGNGFTASGITNSNWSNVTSMCVDPDHANDRILFILGSAASTNTYAAGFIWWERSTSTTTIMTTGISYPSFSLSSNLQRSDLVRCINGYWFTTIETSNSTSKTYHYCTWSGATPPSTWTSRATGSPLSTAARFIPTTIAGISGAMVGSISSQSSGNRPSFPDTSNKGVDATPAFFINSANFGSLPATLTNQSIIEFFVKYGTVDTLTTSLESYTGSVAFCNGATPVCYLPNNNMMFYWNDVFGKFSVSPISPKSTVTNYSSYKPAVWKSYGWDGSSWVIGNTNAKTVHSSSDTLLDGLKIAFSNGVTTPDFVTGESFVFVVGNGLMKDNATDYTFSYNTYPHNTERVSTFYDLTSGVTTSVPNKAVGQLTNELVNYTPISTTLVGKNTFLEQQKKGFITGGTTRSLYADNYIPYSSPFDFSFKLGAMPLIADEKTISLVYYNGSSVSTSSFNIIIKATTIGMYMNGNLIGSAYTPTGIDTVYTLSRGVDGILKFYAGSTLLSSSALINGTFYYPNDVVLSIKTSNSYDGLCGYTDMKLSYYEPRRLVRIGDPTAHTGYFNDNYCGFTLPSIGDDKILVGGVNQTITHSYSSGPAISYPNVKINCGSGFVEFPAMPSVSVSTTSPVTYFNTPSIQPIMASSKSVNKTISIVNGGTGYLNGTFPLVISGGGGTGAAGTCTISGGIVTSATITSGGSGYTSAPTISVDSSAGTPTLAATLTAFIGYAISSFVVLNNGSGLGTSPVVTISAPSGTGGHTATATVTLESSKSLNNMVGLTNNGGAGYTDGTYALICSGGGGTGVTGNVYVSGGKVIYVEVTNQGSGFTSTPTLSFTGAGTPTTAATFSVSIGYKIQSITLTDGGSGYIPHSDLSLSGYVTAHYHL